MTGLPPLDLHAHVSTELPVDALDHLTGVVFAVTRSLPEAEAAMGRNDPTIVWGIGCHPALAEAHATFTDTKFVNLLQQTAFAGELGLDGAARVPSITQLATLRIALRVLRENPRLTSLHSYGATEELIGELQRQPIRHPMLHWWLGDERQTKLALELGCYFSINFRNVRRGGLIHQIPLDRILLETDHPFGDKGGTSPHQPGAVGDVERLLAERHSISQAEVRRAVWQNLANLTAELKCGVLLPRRVRSILASIPRSADTDDRV